jgi:hypothetical protein
MSGTFFLTEFSAQPVYSRIIDRVKELSVESREPAAPLATGAAT